MATTKYNQFWADSSKICYEPTQKELDSVVNPFKIKNEMDQLSEIIKSKVSTLTTEISDLNKEYATEKITASEKKEQIKCSSDIAQYRIINAVKDTINQVLNVLKEERINSDVHHRVKELFDECM
jgi:hypothetical protein